jgi:RND family efflux transporter MFP subunit
MESTRPKKPFRPSRRFPWWIVVVVFVVAASGAYVLWLRNRPVAVMTTPVVSGTAVQAVYATGTVEAEDRVTVKAKTQGNIVDMKVREGSVVHRGDLIARIDSPTLRFELERGRSELWAANSQASQDSPQLASLTAQAAALETQRAQAHDDVVRLEQLVSSGAATQSDLDRARHAESNFVSQIAAIDAQKRALRIDLAAHAQTSASSVDSLAARLKDTEVRSPLDGVVLAKLVEPDEVVMINEPLFRVGDTRKLILECPIDEADIAHVQLGADVAVSLYAFGDTIFAGTVFEILPDADRQKKSFLAKVRLTTPPEGLRSGMTAEVNIITARHPNVLLAPADAVSTDNEVWVVREARARKIRIDIGIRDLLLVEAQTGLHEGDAVIVSPTDLLRPGARVAATIRPPNKSAVPKKSAPNGGSL